MTGHTSWDAFKIRKAPVWTRGAYQGNGNLIAFTRGYILAVEDIIRDLGYLGMDRYAKLQVTQRLTKSLEEAEGSLEKLLEGVDHDGEQGTGGAVDSGSGVR